MFLLRFTGSFRFKSSSIIYSKIYCLSMALRLPSISSFPKV